MTFVWRWYLQAHLHWEYPSFSEHINNYKLETEALNQQKYFLGLILGKQIGVQFDNEVLNFLWLNISITGLYAK